MRSAARQGLVTAQDRHASAMAAVEASRAPLAACEDLVTQARVDLDRIADREREAGAGLAASIKAAIGTGQKPVGVKSADGGRARAAVQAELGAREGALAILKAEHDQLQAAATAAGSALDRAVADVIAEDAGAAVARGLAAVEELNAVRRILLGAERAGSSTAGGWRPAALPAEAVGLIGAIPPLSAMPFEVAPVAGAWQAYRLALSTDPDAEAPSGEAPAQQPVIFPGEGPPGARVFDEAGRPVRAQPKEAAAA